MRLPTAEPGRGSAAGGEAEREDGSGARLADHPSGSTRRRGGRRLEGDEVCETVGLGPIAVSVALDAVGRRSPRAGDHQRASRRQRHSSGPIGDRCAAGRTVVAIRGVHGAGLSAHPRGSRTTAATSGSRPDGHVSTSSIRCASTTTTSRPATTGRSSKAQARDRWSHRTTPATPGTSRRRDALRTECLSPGA